MTDSPWLHFSIWLQTLKGFFQGGVSDADGSTKAQTGQVIWVLSEFESLWCDTLEDHVLNHSTAQKNPSQVRICLEQQNDTS